MIKSKKLKNCNENQIRNPKSLRCVNKNGRLGQLIITLLNLKDLPINKINRFSPKEINKFIISLTSSSNKKQKEKLKPSLIKTDEKIKQLQKLIEELKKQTKSEIKLSPLLKKHKENFKPSLIKIDEKSISTSSNKKIINHVSSNIFDRINYYKKLISNLNISHTQNKFCIRLIKFDSINNTPIFKINGTSIILKNKIGIDNINNVLFSSFFKDKNNKLFKFSTKIILNNDKSNHEITIFSKISNCVLNNKCPHFPFIYKTLKCDRFSNFEKFNDDKIPFKKDDLSFYPRIIRLNPNKSFITILSELANGDLKMFIDDNTIIGNEYQINTLVQILFSLMFFYKEVKCFHNNSNLNNFLFHKINSGGYYHYKFFDNDYYLENIGYLWLISNFSETISFNDAKFNYIPTNNDFINIINSFISSDVNNKINTTTKLAFNQLATTIKNANTNYSRTSMIKLINSILTIFINNNFIKTSISPNLIINKQPFVIKLTDL